jgi:glycosyltransferase involved in cell wall biosynthesis
MPASAVLHVTSIPGGGVDRHIRDIARSSDCEHIVWHAADNGDAIEIPSEKRVLPLDRESFARDPQPLLAFLRSRGVGLVHAHAVTEAPRERATWIADSLGVPKIVTLHDVLFLRREAFDQAGAPAADEKWLRETSAFIRSASAVVAPSEYLAAIARSNLPGVPVDVIANGSGVEFAARDVPVHPDYPAHRFEHVAIVLGAVGPHKGARMLEQTAERLDGTGIGIVVIGYLDESNLPSRHRPHLFVHGSYQDTDVASLVRAYDGRVALFANQVPESFSYALSDVWAAGLPAIVPPTGALGDRVRAHGGGWILPAGFTADDVASLLKRLFAAGSTELARVESELDENDNERVPRLDAMSRSLDALYRRFGIDPASPIDAASAPVQQLLATSLDGSLFRSEMVRFADEIAQLKGALDHERSQYARASTEMKEWIDKLQADVTALQAQVAGESRARAAAQDELFELRNEVERLGAVRVQYENIPRVVRRLFRKKPDGRG